ncbi:MAG: DUF374 domain-containing protein [PS1 clade bacterium]|uniref:DUF374 domain-containing protein n=1 Tax=PS1 clade bacterium TaxID=2175152 RepID=A0A937L6N7_9PROT|nr:DUF374 domain-containing protein [PS1 clade bacterium]
MVRHRAQRAQKAAKNAAQKVADKARNIDLKKVDLPRFDWERGRFVRRDAEQVVGHSFHAQDVAWPSRLVGWLVNRYIRLCEMTSQVTVAGDGPFIKLQAARRPVIVLVWHGRNFQAIPMGRLLISPITVLTSRSRDGAVIANIIRPFGFQAIQGSGTGKAAGKKTNPKKRGAQAFRGMLRHLKNGEMVLATADVPPGPVFEVGPGMVKLAAKSGAAIIGVGASYSPELPLPGTWDKSRLPLPFANRSLAFSRPIYIEAGDDAHIEAECARVTEILKATQAEAEQMLGK